MKIYISLPITGYDIDERKQAAAKVAEELRKDGHEPLNPFDTDKEGMSYGEYLGKDIALIIDQADAMLMLPGWMASKGCRLERECARIHGKNVYNFEYYATHKDLIK